MVVVLLVIASAYLLFTSILAGISQVAQLVVAATISLFAWVSLWDPLEALLFNPIQLMRENFILRQLATLEIVVEAALPKTTKDTVEG